MKEIRKYFDEGYTLPFLRFGMWVVTAIANMPTALSRLCLMDGCHNLDMIISNTPGPKDSIYFCNQKVFDIGGVGSNIGVTGITMLISSYCGKIKIQILTDKDLNMDPQVFLTHLEKQLDQSILDNIELQSGQKLSSDTN